MMWARTMVQNESAIPSWLKISSAEIPATISGTTSGTSIRTFAPGAQRARERTRPIASSVPMIVEATAVSAAISSEANRDWRSDSSAKNSRYHCSEKPSKTFSDLTELNENSTTTTIGANRKRYTQTVKNFRNRGRSKPLLIRQRP